MSPRGVYPHTHIKPREYPADVVELVRRLYLERGMTVEEVQRQIGPGIKVKTLMQRHDIPRRPAAKRHQCGPANTSWVGDDGGYRTAHNRVRSAYGPASTHLCADCGERARDWSYDGTDPNEKEAADGRRFSLDLDHYQPRCGSCHVALDRERDSFGRFAGKEIAS